MLDNLIQSAKALGLMGVVFADQGRGHIVGKCIDRCGELCDPTTLDTHASADAAMRDLGKRLENALQLKARKYPASVA